MCCVEASSRTCATSLCSGVMARLACDDAVDCPGEICCFTSNFASTSAATYCDTDCAYMGGDQVCKEAGDCANGEPCRVFTCGLVAFGLCTAVPPVFCE